VVDEFSSSDYRETQIKGRLVNKPLSFLENMFAGRTSSDHTGHPITLSRTVCILILLRQRGVLIAFVIEHHLMIIYAPTFRV
jgi:hypothetical protein